MEVAFKIDHKITKEDLSRLDTETKRTFPEYIEPITLRPYGKAIEEGKVVLNGFFQLYAPEVWKYITSRLRMMDHAMEA